MRGSDGQLHPRAPPKPLRVSAIFANSVPPPPRDRDYDPSSFYDELVVQVKKNLSQITHSSVYCCFFLSSLFPFGEMRLTGSTMESSCPLPVVSRFHSPGIKVTWTDYAQRRSGRAALASQRLPLDFWRQKRAKHHQSYRCCL